MTSKLRFRQMLPELRQLLTNHSPAGVAGEMWI